MATDFYMEYVFYDDNIQFDSKIQTDIEANCWIVQHFNPCIADHIQTLASFCQLRCKV